MHLQIASWIKIITVMAIVGSPFVANAKSISKYEEKVVTYQDGDTVLEGYLVYSPNLVLKGSTKSLQKAPGVLVVHDWLGVTKKTRDRAHRLAEMGYVAFAADIYGKGVRPKDPKEAGAEATKYKKDRSLFRKRLVLGLEELKKLEFVDSEKLGAIGYCFGGTGVIELARTGAKLRGVVSFHGGLDSPDKTAGQNIKGRVLALHGADDPFVSVSDLAAFEEEMRTHKVDWELIKYGGAVHSFTDESAGTDNSKGAAYNERADWRSWRAMTEFFESLF